MNYGWALAGKRMDLVWIPFNVSCTIPVGN
jgi:hypothetical protein